MNKQDSNYSEIDRLAFESRDKRITKLSCLDRATQIAIALWTHSSVKQIDPTNISTTGVEEICKVAKKFVAWVYRDLDKQDLDKENIENNVTPIIPEPTEQEMDVLKDINYALKKLYPNKVILASTVAAKVYEKYGRYPQNRQSVTKVASELQI